MAATLQAQWNAWMGTSRDPNDLVSWTNAQANALRFRQRISMAAVAAAVTVASEPVNTPNHANRVALAKQVSNVGGEIPAFAQALASQGLDPGSTDAEITAMIASVWNTLAGVV